MSKEKTEFDNHKTIYDTKTTNNSDGFVYSEAKGFPKFQISN